MQVTIVLTTVQLEYILMAKSTSPFSIPITLECHLFKLYVHVCIHVHVYVCTYVRRYICMYVLGLQQIFTLFGHSLVILVFECIISIQIFV